MAAQFVKAKSPWSKGGESQPLFPRQAPSQSEGQFYLQPDVFYGLLVRFMALGLCLGMILFTLGPRNGDSIPPPCASDSSCYLRLFLTVPSNDSLAEQLRVLTSQPHIAGSPQNFVTAQYVSDKLQEYGVPAVHFADFPVLLSYPVSRKLSITKPFQLALPLKEGMVPEDPYSANTHVVGTFHAYSPSGSASGKVVYANFGRTEDFALLASLGVNCSGKIVLSRYGKIYRGDKVFNAAKAGAIASLVYSDPEQFAPQGVSQVYPESQWLPPSGVQRGSVYSYAGDPETPGWPSHPGGERLSLDDPSMSTTLPPIPSLPISYGDALPLLRHLAGTEAPRAWWGALNLSTHRLGPGPVEVSLDLVMNQTVTPIRDVIGLIPGSHEPDRYVIVGNHRDAWTFGAVDPNSGTTALLEMARGFGKLLAAGWRPRRTIIFASWDAEEYALIGSTEWVEANLALLGGRAVAYVNVDCAVAGPGLAAAATPQLDSLLAASASQVEDPDNPGQTLGDTWRQAAVASKGLNISEVARLGGGGSDYASFLQHAGIASADLSFGDSSYPVYHSLYDNFHWMEKFGDPGFQRHVAITRLWGIIALRLAGDEILPFDYSTYAAQLERYTNDVEEILRKLPGGNLVGAAISTQPLHQAVAAFTRVAAEVGEEIKALANAAEPSGTAFASTRAINDRLMLAERAFLDADGLKGKERRWYKHLVYAPAIDDNYGSTAFPSISDALLDLANCQNASNEAAVQHEIFRVARAIQQATSVLGGTIDF